MLQKYNHSFLYTTPPYAKLPKMRGGAVISRYSKLVYIIMFRISRYALAHSFAQKHCTNSYQLNLNTYLYSFEAIIDIPLFIIILSTLTVR